MDWGNAIVRSKTIDASGVVTAIEMDLHLDGDFKKTKKKITWLAQPTTEYKLIPVTLLDHDYLITKKKLDENDNLDDFITPVTEYKEIALADASVRDLKKGDCMQFERKGYFMFDGESEDGRLEFIKVPDGKAAGLASKASPTTAPVPAVVSASAPAPAASLLSSMYKVENIYGTEVTPASDTQMYKVPNIYTS